MNNSISAFSGNNLSRLNGATEKIQYLLQLIMKMADSLVYHLTNFHMNVLRTRIVYVPPFLTLIYYESYFAWAREYIGI